MSYFLEQQERAGDELSTGYLNEKIDVYALGKHQEKPMHAISKNHVSNKLSNLVLLLGNILYKVAVGNSPWKVSLFLLLPYCNI